MSLGLTRRFRYSLALNARGPMFIKAIYVGACASTASDRARPPCDEERSADEHRRPHGRCLTHARFTCARCSRTARRTAVHPSSAGLPVPPTAPIRGLEESAVSVVDGQ